MPVRYRNRRFDKCKMCAIFRLS